MILTKLIKTSANVKSSSASKNIYDIEINSITGEPINLSDYRGKKILFVNVASKCGFTPQYKSLQEIYTYYSDKLVIIGVPCNQFGRQESGTQAQIQHFCEVNYGVTFPITEKIDVKGNEQHPLYSWLTKKSENGKKSSSVKWNFQKYLVDENGELIDYFLSITKPSSTRILKHFR